jgi:hypothetical protein
MHMYYVHVLVVWLLISTVSTTVAMAVFGDRSEAGRDLAERRWQCRTSWPNKLAVPI